MKRFALIAAGMPWLFIAHATVVAAQVTPPKTNQQEQQTLKSHAHVHGVGSLQIVVDGYTLMLSLESPLDNLLGFEHMPRTEQQKAAVREMAARLNQVATLFVPTPAAFCRAESVKLDSPVLDPTKNTVSDAHADLDAEFIFRCQRPDALRDLEVAMFDGFPDLHQFDVQVVSSRGQSAARLSSSQRRIAW